MPTSRPFQTTSSTEARIAFWKNTIGANFQPEAQELIVYFCVTRSASRAQTIQQRVLTLPEVDQADCKAEVLRLVGWEFDKPRVTVEVRATSELAWACEQINEMGLREPFGYIVLSSVFAPGLINSMTVARSELVKGPVRFSLSEDSSYLRV